MRPKVRKFKFITPSVSTSWLYSDKPCVPEQFLCKEASETHILILRKKNRTNPCAKMVAGIFVCFHHHHQQNIVNSKIFGM